MNYGEFVEKAQKVLPVGEIFNNPGGGTSVIISVTDDNIRYRRGAAIVNVSFQNLYNAYTHFKGQKCSSNDLRAFRPNVFDSNTRPPIGRSSNCTFLFSVLKKMGLCGDIQGAGAAGHPFWVNVL